MTQENLIQEEQARQQREKVLQRSEAELHALIETIPHGIENIDLSGTITFANSALHKMYEHGEGQLLGTSILDHVAEEPEREKLQAFLQYLVKEQPAPAQYLGKKRTKKGRVIHVQVVWNYRRDEQERVTGFTSVITDITSVSERAAQLKASNKELEASEEALRQVRGKLERRVQERVREMAAANTSLRTEIKERRRAEKELINSQGQLSAVLDTAGEGIITIDSTSTIVMVNQEVQRIWGYQREELVGKKLHFLMPEKYRGDHSAGMKRYLRTGVERVLGKRMELGGLKQDGSTFPLEIRITETRTGQSLLFTAAVRDITARKRAEEALRSEIKERKRAEEELQVRRDELAHMSRVVAMGELATSIAHEINQPLTAILTSAGAARRLLVADEPDFEKLDEAQQNIVESATRAGEIIRHQYDFLRRGELKKTPVAINQLIRNIVHVTRAEVLRSKITLSLDLAPDLPSIIGDPIQLEQVILNLIRNSLEAMSVNDH